MAMNAAYLDDSGTHADSPFVSVAGAIGAVPLWGKFSDKWNRKLSKLGLEHFHMAEFVSGYGPYNGWDQRKRHAVLSGFIQLITNHASFLVGAATTPTDFSGAYARCPTPYIKDAYHLCAVLTLPSIGYWVAESHTREPAAVIFETGNKLMDEYVRAIRSDFTERHRQEQYGINSVTVGTKKDFPPLQAADIIAYGTYKARAQKTGLQPYLQDAYSSLFKMPNSGVVLNQDMIERVLTYIKNDSVKNEHLYRDLFKGHSSGANRVMKKKT
jgi:Protein of unknown function (DUF3800)